MLPSDRVSAANSDSVVRGVGQDLPGMPRSAAMRPVTLPMMATKTARRSGDVDARVEEANDKLRGVILDAREKSC